MYPPDVIDIAAVFLAVHVLELSAALLKITQLTQQEIGQVVA